MSLDWTALWLTFKLAALTTLLLIPISTPIALWLAFGRSRFKPVWEALVALPLVLPPTVLGFYLLLMLAPDSALGRWYASLTGGGQLTFSFTGILIASLFYSLPFGVQPLMQAFRQVGQAPLQTAALLGAGSRDQFWRVLLPLSLPGYLVAATLVFAHTVGEFGVILMVGGNIPGVTQVASIAIYDAVENMDYAQAHGLSAVLLLFSFVTLLSVYLLSRRLEQRRG